MRGWTPGQAIGALSPGGVGGIAQTTVRSTSVRGVYSSVNSKSPEHGAKRRNRSNMCPDWQGEGERAATSRDRPVSG